MTGTIPSIAVLRNEGEAVAARAWLRGRGWDLRARPMLWAREYVASLLRTRHRLYISFIKGWDVALFARALTSGLPATARILDVGGVSSELPWVLHLAGYTRITACDLDESVTNMPFRGPIRYRVGNIGSLGLHDGSLDAITAVSTIEHGIELPEFFATAARLTRPGGWLCVSTDYWSQKVDTSDIRFFGLPWNIFSEHELKELIQTADAAGFGLDYDGRIPEVVEAPVVWNDRRYTFIALLFRRR